MVNLMCGLVIAIVSAIVILLHHHFYPLYASTQGDLLEIFILSAHGHFSQREAQHASWVNKAGLLSSVDVRFVVGNQFCPIHPNDRISTLECKLWNVSLQDDIELVSAVALRDENYAPSTETLSSTAFKFNVLHSIKLKFVGLCRNGQSSHGGSAIITLYDRVSGGEILSVHTDNISLADYSMNEPIIWLPVAQHVTLPKGFQGILVSDDLNCSLHHHGDIECSPFIDCISGLGDSLLNLKFDVEDFEKLDDHIRGKQLRNSSWHQLQMRNVAMLKRESGEYDDIIHVHLVDVYRNLPDKLLQTMAWFLDHSNAAFFMKTDDDCYLNVQRIMDRLSRLTDRKKIWLGSFRENWAVEDHGKWAEHDYESVSYPPFACGSGYILSRDLVTWLVHNKDYLHRFQGEDVSLGIWLSAVQPIRIHDDRFCCGEECHVTSFTQPELTPELMDQMHHGR